MTQIFRASRPVPEAPPSSSGCSQRFVFDHVTKTGGTSFHAALASLLGAGALSPPIVGRSLSWALKTYQHCQVISGHFINAPGDGWDGRHHLTLLRDPIDRVLSIYSYLRNNVDADRGRAVGRAAKKYDLAGFLSFYEDTDLQNVSNHYCRHLAERQSRESDGQEGLLALARQSLAAFHFVGITEQLAESLDLFCLRYRLPAPDSLPRLNESAAPLRKADLSDALLQRLTDLNRLDLQLYGEACARLAAEQRQQLHACLLERQGMVMPPVAAPPPETPTLPRRAEDFGNRQIVIVKAEIIGALSGGSSVSAGEPAALAIDISASIALDDLTIGMQIFDENGATVFGTNSYLLGCRLPIAPDRQYRLTYHFPVHLGLGHYEVGVALHTGADHHDRCFHWWDRAARFDVVDQGSQRFIGYAQLPVTSHWQELSAAEKSADSSWWRRLRQRRRS